MNRLTSGMVSLCALFLAVACKGDPTEPLRAGGADKLIASPSQLFIQLGQSKAVDVGAVDAQGNQLDFDYLATPASNLIAVKRDSSFRGVFINDSTFAVPAVAQQFRFTVTGMGYGATSFTVSAGGKDVVVPVQVVAQTQIATTFSTNTPALGDTVTITAPAGNTFTQTALLQIAGAADSLNPRIVERDPNGAFIRFIPPPNLNGPLTITEVKSDGAPSLTFRPATSTLLTTPLFDTVDVTYSTAAPALGGAVTATIDNPLIKFRPDTKINFPEQLPGRASGPAGITVSADSATLAFQAPPNANGVGTVVSFVFPGGFSFALPTRTGITAPNIGTTLAATFNPPTPGILQPVTITAPAGFIFGPLATDSVTIGGRLAINQSGGGGNTITVLPIPGSSGVATIAGISNTTAPQFVFTMNTVASVTAPDLTPLAGTDDPTTAPSITVPGIGSSAATNDAGSFTGEDITGDGGVGAQYYKFDMPAAGNITIGVDWVGAADIDLVICDDVGGVLDPDTCQFAAATGAHPESAVYALGIGTHYAAVVSFDGGVPPFLTVTLTR